MESQFDPYYTWLGIPPSQRPPTLYRLLGLQDFEPNGRAIEHAADRVMLHLRSFQLGANAAAAQYILNEVAAARVALLDPQRKAYYDQQLYAQRMAQQSAVASPPTRLTTVIAPYGSYGSPRPALPQAPVPVAPVASPVVPSTDSVNSVPYRSSSAVRRRHQENPIVTLLKIVVGGAGGLALGILLVWVVFKSDPFGLFGDSGERSQETTVARSSTEPPREELQRSPRPSPLAPPSHTEHPPRPPVGAPPTSRPMPIPAEPPKLVIPPAPNPPASTVQTTSDEEVEDSSPISPASKETNPPDRSPEAVTLPPLTTKSPETLVLLTQLAAESVDLRIASTAAEIPDGAAFFVERSPGEPSVWLLRYTPNVIQPDLQGYVDIGLFRVSPDQLAFQWSESASDSGRYGQLANCLVQMNWDNESKIFALRKPVLGDPLTISVDEETHTLDFDIPDLPRSDRISVTVGCEDLPVSMSGKGFEATVELNKRFAQDFARLPGAELQLRFIRRQSGQLSLNIAAVFRERQSTFPLTRQQLDKTTLACEKGLASTKADIDRWSAELNSLESQMGRLRSARLSSAQQRAAAQVEFANLQSAAKRTASKISNARRQIPVLEARKAAIPAIDEVLKSIDGKRLTYHIYADYGKHKLTLARSR